MDKNLISLLNKHNIKFKVHEHEPVFTVEESNSLPQIKNIPGIRTKNLFLKDENINYYLICLRGTKRLNIKLLENSLKVKHLKFASPEELKNELNLTPGSVSIFGMIYSKERVLLILDKETFDSDIISFHPNINTSTLELTHDNLVNFLNAIKVKYKVIEL